jgi:hypothetical protein
LDKSVAFVCKLIPKDTQVVEYGRAQRLEGGDSMQARDLVSLGSDSRDMSFVRVRSSN